MGGFEERVRRMTRRHFFGLNSTGVGLAALASLATRDARADASAPKTVHGGRPGLPEGRGRRR